MASEARAKRVCSQCQEALQWDAAAGQLRCQACGAEHAVEPVGQISEHDLEEALAQRKARGPIGTGSRLIRCVTCQAEVELPDEIQATRCEFCRSALVLPFTASEDHYLPESLIPFAIDRTHAERAFARWLRGLWFRPRNLRQAASLTQLHGVYIPYWAFGCEVTTRWTADAGYIHYEDKRVKTEQGEETRRVAHTRWEPCRGERHDPFEDHLLCASRGLLQELSGDVQRFDTSGLLPYSSEYLLGFSAERYAIDLKQAWQSARIELSESQTSRCLQDIPGDTQRNVRTTHQFQRVRFKHVLLPMWIAAYEYRGRVHRFLVNGQTGEVEGTAPHSAAKIAALVLVVVTLLALAFYLFQPRPPKPPQSPSHSAPANHPI